MAKDFVEYFESRFSGLEGVSLIAPELPTHVYTKPKKVETEEPVESEQELKEKKELADKINSLTHEN